MVRRTKSSKCLVGKTAIITGANTGIGYCTALEFAKRGCRTILACRNQEKGKEAQKKIIELTGNENVAVKPLDLQLLESVRDFCKDIIETEDRLDILVNNAAAYHLENKTTPDGLQLEMATNYFSPFLLTNLLLDLLKKSVPSRIVNVASKFARFYDLDLETINEFNGHVMLYTKSKICNVYFAIELAKKLEGSGVTTYSVHPGVVYTEIVRNSSVYNFFAKHLFLTAQDGAQTSVYCALEEGIEKYNGRYFENCQVHSSFTSGKHEEKARKLWDITEKLVGLTN